MEICSALMWPGQRTIAGTRKCALPIGIFLTTEWCHGGSGQENCWVRCRSCRLRSCYRRCRDLQRLEQLADIAVVLDHAIGVFVVGHAALAAHGSRTWVKTACGWCSSRRRTACWRVLPPHVVDRRIGCFIVDGFHPLLGQRTGILDRLLADASPVRMCGWIVASVALVRSTPRGELLTNSSYPWASLDAQVPPRRSGDTGCRRTHRSHALSADIRCDRRDGFCRTGRWRNRRLQRFGNGHVSRLQANRRAWYSDFGHPCSLGSLTSDER